MWECIREVVYLFTNNSISNGSKGKTALIIIGLILLVDNSLGTSNYYSRYLQLEQLKNISEIKDRYKNDKRISELLFHAETTVMERKSLIRNIRTGIEWIIYDAQNVNSGESIQKGERGWVHIITSSFAFVIASMFMLVVMILMPIIGVVNKWQGVMFGVFVNVLLGALALLFILASGLIPPIFGYLYINYIIQSLVQFLILHLFIRGLQKITPH